MVPLSGQILALLLPHDTLVLQVTLVSHQDHRYLAKNQHSGTIHEADKTEVKRQTEINLVLRYTVRRDYHI